MQDEQPRNRLSMAVPNGIILGLIGALVLVTPLTTEVAGNQLPMDLVAGAALVMGGATSLVWGLRSGRDPSPPTD